MVSDIKAAYKQALEEGLTFTDDSAVYARYVGKPHLCAGENSNKKLTYGADFEQDFPPFTFAPTARERVGLGVDVHAFGGDSHAVILAGCSIPCDVGLIAHSDGDVLVHAVMDALLSAAGLKDIGHYFPDSAPALNGISSMVLLTRVKKLLTEHGFAAKQVAVTVQAEKPRLAAHIAAMRQNIAEALNLPYNFVSIAAGTCEHLGFVGMGLGIACYALCTLTPIK
jgi:2-C-methyl-D-erythritol 2,4-cyclodiphosphate synthase